METKETQTLQVGVRKLDGTVQLVGATDVARQHRDQINKQARGIGAEPTAEVVRRRVTTVTRATATPWEVAR